MPGEEYDNVTKTCTKCAVGYYNDDLDPAKYTCTMCPADFVTSNTGSTKATDCNVRKFKV